MREPGDGSSGLGRARVVHLFLTGALALATLAAAAPTWSPSFVHSFDPGAKRHGRLATEGDQAIIGGENFIDIVEAGVRFNDWQLVERIALQYDYKAAVAMDAQVFAYAVPTVVSRSGIEISSIYLRPRSGGSWRKVAEVPGLVGHFEVDQGTRMVVGFSPSWANFKDDWLHWSWILEYNGNTFQKVAEIERPEEAGRCGSGPCMVSHIVQLDGDYAAALVRVYNDSLPFDINVRDIVIYERIGPGQWEPAQLLELPEPWIWWEDPAPFDMKDGLLVVRTREYLESDGLMIFRRQGSEYVLEETLPLPESRTANYDYGSIATDGSRIYLGGGYPGKAPVWCYEYVAPVSSISWAGWVHTWTLEPGSWYLAASKDWLLGSRDDQFMAFLPPP